MSPRPQRNSQSRVPTARDISPSEGVDLDEQWALKHFLGRDVEGALELLRENFLCYEEDLLFMGRRGFEYYLPAVLLYLQELDDDDFVDEVDLAFNLLKFRLETEGATEFGISHYAITEADMAAHPHACALREYCVARLESLAAQDEPPLLPSERMLKKAGRWRGLF